MEVLHLIKKYSFFIIIAVIIVGIGTFIFINEAKPNADSNVEMAPTITLKDQDENMVNEISALIKVDVKGEINKPGVYEVKQDYRIIDVIQLAGGLTKLADETKINLAQKVTDEMVIIVPKEGDEEFVAANFNLEQEDGKINLNEASVEEITTLNGIGPKKAQAIVDYREENGPFQQEEDLLNISGIGEKTLENIRDEIIVP